MRIIELALVTASAVPALGMQPFTEEAVSRGVVYEMQGWPQITGHLGFGCGFADLDGDNDPDIVIIGAANGRVGIFENDGTGHFLDRSEIADIPFLPEPAGFAAADYDGDGDVDLYFTNVGEPNVLVRNEGNFIFVDVTNFAGVDGDSGAGEGVSFGDFDDDGWLDLYVCNYKGIVAGTSQIDNKLYHNLADGTFDDVASALGVEDDAGLGFQSVWFDYDRDGDVDLYLSNDRGHLAPNFKGNRLWRNDAGNFVDVSIGSGAGLHLFSMGVACGDFDGNRWPDLYCTNIPGGGGMDNPLMLNQGNGLFVESSGLAGVGNPDSGTSWGCIFFDYNNDTHLDLYVNNQYTLNTFYENDGTFPCVEISDPAGVQGSSGLSFGSAVADVDDDGDLDLLVNNLGANVELFINHEGQTRNFIKYRMVGLRPNFLAVGGSVDSRTGSVWQWREVLAGGNNYLGQNETVIHVGLGRSPSVDEIVVTWPGGDPSRTLTNLPANQTWALYPPQHLGDFDGDDDVLLADFAHFVACLNSGFEPGCEMMDFNGNSIIDTATDYAEFRAAYEGISYDCNSNGVFDFDEIMQNLALDEDENGELDDCGTEIPATAKSGMIVIGLAIFGLAASILPRRQLSAGR